MSVRRTVLAALSVAALLAGCTRGKSAEEKAREEKAKAAGGPAATATAAGLDGAWRDGVLPKDLDRGTPVPGGTLTVRINLEPAHLGYLIEPDWWLSRIILHNVNESLVRPDPRKHPTYDIAPELAESWEESPDHLTFTFRLRKGVKWHDGKPFTSRDVKFTFDRLMDPKVRASSQRNSFVDLESTAAPDEHTFVLKWKKPYVWTMRALATLPIYPAHAFAGHEGEKFNTAPFMRSPIGTGPFRFDSWEDQKAINFARFDDYWGQKAHVDRLVYRIVQEPNVAQQLLMRGEIDLDLNLTSEQYVEAEKEPKLVEAYHRIKIFDSNYGWIGWNLERPMFKDRRVRTALAMLLDRETVRTTLLKSVPVEANCIFYHLGRGCDPATRQARFDPAGAAKLLAEAGWKDADRDGVLDKDGTPFRFSVLFPSGNPVNEQVMLIYRDQLRRAGIGMELLKIEWSVFTGKLRKHEFDACMLAWVGEVEDDPYQLWHSSQNQDGTNYVNYSNPEIDALVLQIRGEFDAARRQELFRKFNAIIVADAPYTLLFHNPRRTLVHRRLRGVYESPIESFQFREMWIDPNWKPKGG